MADSDKTYIIIPVEDAIRNGLDIPYDALYTTADIYTEGAPNAPFLLALPKTNKNKRPEPLLPIPPSHTEGGLLHSQKTQNTPPNLVISIANTPLATDINTPPNSAKLAPLSRTQITNLETKPETGIPAKKIEIPTISTPPEPDDLLINQVQLPPGDQFLKWVDTDDLHLTQTEFDRLLNSPMSTDSNDTQDKTILYDTQEPLVKNSQEISTPVENICLPGQKQLLTNQINPKSLAATTTLFKITTKVVFIGDSNYKRLFPIPQDSTVLSVPGAKIETISYTAGLLPPCPGVRMVVVLVGVNNRDDTLTNPEIKDLCEDLKLTLNYVFPNACLAFSKPNMKIVNLKQALKLKRIYFNLLDKMAEITYKQTFRRDGIHLSGYSLHLLASEVTRRVNELESDNKTETGESPVLSDFPTTSHTHTTNAQN